MADITTNTAAPIERKYLAHFIDASFGGTENYVRLGIDLEEFNEELNPDIEQKKNILGENRVLHNGYEVSSDVEPFYAYEGDPLWSKLQDIANNRKTGTDCVTKMVTVLLKTDGTAEWAYRENVYVVPTSLGGDTSGIQIPFTVYNTGDRKSVTMTVTNTTTGKKYTFA